MVKKIIIYVILIVVLIVIGTLIFLHYQNSKAPQKEVSIQQTSSALESAQKITFKLDNVNYEFSFPNNWSVDQKSTGKLNGNDEFKIFDENKNKVISLTILKLSEEGLVKQSLDPSNEANIIINNINGETFKSSDNKSVYLLDDEKYNYLWINDSADNLLFDEIVKSFKKI